MLELPASSLDSNQKGGKCSSAFGCRLRSIVLEDPSPFRSKNALRYRHSRRRPHGLQNTVPQFGVSKPGSFATHDVYGKLLAFDSDDHR